MSWLSKQLKSAKKMVTHPKAWAGNALQTAGQAAPYAAAAMAIPGLGAGLGKAASAIGLGGLRRVLPNTKMPLPQGTIPGLTLPGEEGSGGGFDWGSLLGTAGSFLKNNAVDLGIGGLAGYQALNAANASKRAGQLQDKAISGAEKRWGDNEALRAEGRRRLLNPTRPNLSSVFADPTNPFASRPSPAIPMPQPTPTVPVGPAVPRVPRILSPPSRLLPPPQTPVYTAPVQGVPRRGPQKRLLPAPY